MGPRDPDPDPQEIFADPEHCFFEIMITGINFSYTFQNNDAHGEEHKNH